MSISQPNYNKLPSRQAAKRAEKRQLTAIEKAVQMAVTQAVTPPVAEKLDMGAWHGRKSPPKRPSRCHPRRAEAGDGLCKWCLGDRINRTERSAMSPEEALEEVTRKGGDAEVGKLVRAKMVTSLSEYARLHLEGSRVAALKGETKGIEWALQSIRAGDGPVVPPAAKDGGGGGGGVRVLIGVNLGGLPRGTAPQPIIDVASVTAVAPSDTDAV